MVNGFCAQLLWNATWLHKSDFLGPAKTLASSDSSQPAGQAASLEALQTCGIRRTPPLPGSELHGFLFSDTTSRSRDLLGPDLTVLGCASPALPLPVSTVFVTGPVRSSFYPRVMGKMLKGPVGPAGVGPRLWLDRDARPCGHHATMLGLSVFEGYVVSIA